MTASEELRSLREQAGMSKRALARHWGVSRQAIQNFERGTAPVPQPRLAALRALVRS